MAQQTGGNPAYRYPLLSRSFEGAISAETYVLGPGDVLLYSLWGDKSVSFTLPVTPQGKLILPNIGEFEASGKTLAAIKADLDAHIQKVFTSRSTSLILKTVRTFRVHVVGEVKHPGDVVVSAIDRVSDAIALAGGLTQKSSFRNIRVIAQNGEKIRVDLLEYDRIGDLSANPTLRDGDIVRVPVASHRITVSGAVLRPADFEWVPGETVAEAIRLAGGLCFSGFHHCCTLSSRWSHNSAPVYFNHRFHGSGLLEKFQTAFG
ncbi:MAG: polysaccharide export protein [Calditrichaeota bacterium]|nr:polysaccharide export protein [Calditrichota bacterium]